MAPRLAWLAFIGRHTLIIYLLHFFLYNYVRFQPQMQPLYASGNHIPLLCVTALVSAGMIGVCLVAEWCILQSRLLAFALLGKDWRR